MKTSEAHYLPLLHSHERYPVPPAESFSLLAAVHS